jgi:hypothetical protein
MTPVTRSHANDGIWGFGIGDLVSRQELDALFSLEFPVGVEGEGVEARIRIIAGDGELSSEAVELRWAYADQGANDRQPRDREVDRKVAAIYAARARQEALLLNRDGQFDAAGQRLKSVANRIESFAGDDPVLLDMASSILREADEVVAPVAPLDRKAKYYASHTVLYDRSPSGTARRRDEE